MSRFKDLTGERFGRLIVTSRADDYRWQGKERVYSYVCWNCLCDCGNTHVVRMSHLTLGRVTSCGCYLKEVRGNHNRLRPFESLFREVKSKAAQAEKELGITYEQFVTFTSTKQCHYCYAPISWATYNVAVNGAAYNLDRTDNEQGYHMANLVVCCRRCNFSKGDRFSYSEWMQAMTFLRDQRGGDHANNPTTAG